MVFLVCISILFSLITTFSLLGLCVNYIEKANLHTASYDSDIKNYEMWKNNGILMTIIIMFVIIVWLILANITIAYDLYNCKDDLCFFLNIFFIITATFLSFFILFRELGLKQKETNNV